MRRLWYGLMGCMLFLSACTEEKPPSSSGTYSEGVFTINEGVFGQTSGTISYYNRTNGTVQQKIFKQVNGRDLGDVVQSMSFYEDRAYIVVNNSNKIEVADANTFEEKAQIIGLRLPRYCLAISTNKAYVTEWGDDGLTGTIAILDLNTHTVINRIAVGVGPEQLLFKDAKLYITHVGGYGTNNIVTVLNTVTDQIETTISVFDKPSACVEDVDGFIWVACAGKVAYLTYPTIDTANSTASGLIRINPTNNAITKTISFGKGKPIGNLIINTANKGELYYSRTSQVWKYHIGTDVEESLFNGSFYGLGFDPVTNYIYAATSVGVNAAEARRYDTNGMLIDAYTVGVFANGFVFK
ncbi:DUF5074 domain-containing protein [Aureispira sp. CCB-E]|uniref:YncE family protein n=1 Tax=Aureispira sp. CCB-E TaxID=3051121 RepID=UPI0028687703|nr:DUF5074 domain-containing protein [Aureispira sp. CCB-E]WMX13689.1 hypothetical protein QP953_22815 [Aureispira sp. CCB-E]